MLDALVDTSSSVVLLPLLIVSLCLYSYVLWAEHINKELDQARMMTNRPEQPHFVRMENFFTPFEFNQVKSTLADGFLARIKNSLNTDNFGNTLDLSLIHSFIERVMHPEANAFVVNILRAEGVTNLKSVAAAAGWHYDNTLSVVNPNPYFWKPSPHGKFTWPFCSHQTTVVYIKVPTDLEGGELLLSPPVNVTQIPTGQVMVTPRENVMVCFRGDSGHAVRGFKSKSGQIRVSLVLEQYILSKTHLLLVPTFQASHPDH
eukprot:gene26136-11856_t